ncbi:GlxA family transcriptional regulator [Rathayibacter sp. KR2-224]|uniref:GlxA family transcriptional regulator n=1 Tax=Rathayibacter sp. KR2-224 TaxID=3400913 RepID=UPI003C0F56A5
MVVSSTRRRGVERDRHLVAVLALGQALPMEIGMPFQIFDHLGLPYDVVLCGRQPGPIETTAGWTVNATHGLDAVVSADTVIVPAFRNALDGAPEDAAEALREAHRRGARMVSICTGAFALASAGLLDGRRATTHWRYTDALARLHPLVTVDPHVLFVDEGDVITSAGVASGIDVCLHIVRLDHGAAVANAVARDIVAAPHRDGGQAQFIERSPAAEPHSARLAETRAWALDRLDQALTVGDLAAHAHASARTFARAFVAETGTTPLKWLNAARVDRARELLETTDLGVDRIAEDCGLGTAANLRAHFRRATGVSPSDYRRTFAAA